MKTNAFRYTLLVMSFLVMSVGIANAAAVCQTYAGSSFRILNAQWGNSTHPISGGPGLNDVPLTVTLEPYGTDTCVLNAVTGHLGLDGGITNFNGSSYSVDNIESVTPYQVFNMVFNLNIPSNQSFGPGVLLSYPLYISWNYTNETTRNIQEYNLSVPLKGSPDLVFSTKSPSLAVGNINNITIVVSNEGTGTVSDLVPSVAASGLSIINQPQPIASLGPYSTETTSFDAYVPSGSSGQSVILDLDSHYISPYGYNTSITSDVGMYAQQVAISQVQLSTSTQTLVSGEVQNISIIVTNNETVPITNVSLALGPQSPLSIIGSGDLINIPYIAAQSSASVPVEFYATSSTSAVSTLDVGLTYNLGNAAETSTRSITFLTPGYIDMSVVSTTVLPTTPVQGEIFSVTSTLENIGSQTAYAATVTPIVPAGLKLVGQNTTFIGDIATQTPTAFTMSFTALSSAKSGKYDIPVTIAYLNNLNQPLNTTLYYSINVGAANTGNTVVSGTGNYVKGSGSYNGAYPGAPEASGSFPTVPVVVVIIIIVVVAWYLYKRRKKAAAALSSKAKVSHK